MAQLVPIDRLIDRSILSRAPLEITYLQSPALLKIDPNFDPLRGNPRFQRLVEQAR